MPKKRKNTGKTMIFAGIKLDFGCHNSNTGEFFKKSHVAKITKIFDPYRGRGWREEENPKDKDSIYSYLNSKNLDRILIHV